VLVRTVWKMERKMRELWYEFATVAHLGEGVLDIFLGEGTEGPAVRWRCGKYY
jgi:hypothetical protein